MLAGLQVRNYVLIDSLDIEFPGGLIIITGQTGAGKSILLGALSLVLGSKADAAAIAQGAESCLVEARFLVDPEDSALKTLFEENDLDWEGGEIILRRTVARSGRSRSFINDVPVTLPVLGQLSSRLLDIHSQHQTQLLNDHAFQLGILDRFAGNSALLEECAQAWRELGTLKSQLSDLVGRIAAIERDREYNEAQFSQLDAARLEDGEMEALEEEQKKLANAEEIKTLLSECEGMANLSAGDVEFSLTNSLREIQRRLDRLSRYIPETADLSSRVDSCRLELEDIVAEISDMNCAMDVSGERLAFVEERLSLIYTLLKKHACTSVRDLIELRDSLGENLVDSSLLEERRKDLEKAVAAAEKRLERACAALHASRAAAAKPFADAILEAVRFLEMPQAVFQVALSPAPASRSGSDSVSFLFSADGRNPVDVSRCASGGEMSRIMLALKDMMARHGDMPTMIFDEIDTGVSGSVADRMGSMICSMGRNMQVFAITHLPQVAAKGDAHYLVSKTLEGGRSVTEIEKLSAEQRVFELARMLSGSTLTEAAIANARALLDA